jgi:hypothetical protein
MAAYSFTVLLYVIPLVLVITIAWVVIHFIIKFW